MKKVIAAIATAGSIALMSPLTFSLRNVVEGCHDSSYRYATINGTASQLAAAKDAKLRFCRTAKAATENARLTW